jgi:hypothetical protein
MHNAMITTEDIISQIKTLPKDSLDDLAAYVEFLRFKAQKSTEEEPAEKRLRIVKLSGLLKGYDVSPERLAEIRREMWRKFEVPES